MPSASATSSRQGLAAICTPIGIPALDVPARTVTTGQSAGGMIEITDGLEEGEQVVVVSTVITGGDGGQLPGGLGGELPGGGQAPGGQGLQ